MQHIRSFSAGVVRVVPMNQRHYWLPEAWPESRAAYVRCRTPDGNVRCRTDDCARNGYWLQVAHGLEARDADLVVIVPVRPAKAGTPCAVMLARARRSGIFELLAAEAWAEALGYAPGELNGKSLRALMRLEQWPARDVVAALLGESEAQPLDISLRCKNERRKRYRLYRRFDAYEEAVFVVADELPEERAGAPALCA